MGGGKGSEVFKERDILREEDDRKLVEAIRDLVIYVEDLDQFMPQPLYCANPAGVIAEANKSLEELTSYTRKELIGQPVSILFANKEDARDIGEETVRKGKVKARGSTILTKEKREVPVSISTSLRKDREGDVIGYFAALTEVTEHKRAQERIEQAVQGWRATLDAIRDLVWISDKDCQLIRVNRAYADAVGMEPKQLIGKTCHEVLAWAKETCPRCPHRHTIATREPATEEFLNPEQGINLEISTSPILNEEGEVIASVCVARDITERKQAEMEIQALNRLRQYFSPKLAQRLISDEDIYRVRRKDLTIFFCDMRGSTALSDELEPEELLNMLNEFFSKMTEVVFDWGGTVSKFTGDGIMGYFGDPEENINHAELAVKMALEMQARVKTLNEESLLWRDLSLSIGIGLDTGYVTLGNIGPENHRDYTVVGRHVNLASRLEDEAKPGQVVISQSTYRMVADIIKAEELGEISVKGFEKPVLVYNVVGLV